MTDIESRLRSAMSTAADQPPADLMERIRRRHRRHVRRVVAACASALAVIAVAAPSAIHVLGTGQPSAGQASGEPLSGGQPVVPGSSHAPTPTAAAGTILRDCASQNYSDLSGTNWKARSIQAGPLWFVYARTSGLSSIVAVRAGATVVVRDAPAAHSRYLFLPGTNASVRAGKPGVTFVACPASYMGPITFWWVSYNNAGLRCVPLQVQTPNARKPIRVVLSAGGKCSQ
jgi:hypothetical protein